jgi:hypothetical protein
MLVIVDNKISKVAKERLSQYGDLLELKTEGITYPAISGHPDIFICQAGDILIVAPNLPEQYLTRLKNVVSNIITGEFPVGSEYPATSRYNAVATPNYLIHNFRHTDFMITRTLEDLQPVQVDQGYCRCNLLPLKDDHFITSDTGIYKVLKGLSPGSSGLHPDLIYVSPGDILLQGFPHGFFGGCCGILGNKVFVNGSLNFYKDGNKVRDFLGSMGYKIVELADDRLMDCGSIMFVVK